MKVGVLLGALVALTLVGGAWVLLAPQAPGKTPGLPRLRPGGVWHGEGQDDPEVRALARECGMRLDPKGGQGGLRDMHGPWTVDLEQSAGSRHVSATVRRAWWPLW